MGIDTESGTVFMRHSGRIIRHLEKHQDIAMEYHYLDTSSGREFDVRDLPAEHMGDKRARVLDGERDAHKHVIRHAIDAGHDF